MYARKGEYARASGKEVKAIGKGINRHGGKGVNLGGIIDVHVDKQSDGSVSATGSVIDQGDGAPFNGILRVKVDGEPSLGAPLNFQVTLRDDGSVKKAAKTG